MNLSTIIASLLLASHVLACSESIRAGSYADDNVAMKEPPRFSSEGGTKTVEIKASDVAPVDNNAAAPEAGPTPWWRMGSKSKEEKLIMETREQTVSELAKLAHHISNVKQETTIMKDLLQEFSVTLARINQKYLVLEERLDNSWSPLTGLRKLGVKMHENPHVVFMTAIGIAWAMEKYFIWRKKRLRLRNGTTATAAAGSKADMIADQYAGKDAPQLVKKKEFEHKDEYTKKQKEMEMGNEENVSNGEAK